MRLVVASLALTIVGAYLFMLEPLYTAEIIDQVITQGKSQALQGLVTIIVLAVLAFGIVSLANTYVQGYLAQMISKDVRSDYYSSLQRKSFRFYDSSAVGDLVSRATMDMQAVEAFAKTWIGTLANAVFAIVIAFSGSELARSDHWLVPDRVAWLVPE